MLPCKDFQKSLEIKTRSTAAAAEPKSAKTIANNESGINY